MPLPQGEIDFSRFHKMMTGAQPTPAQVWRHPPATPRRFTQPAQAPPQVEDPTLRAAMTEARKHPSAQPQPGTAACFAGLGTGSASLRIGVYLYRALLKLASATLGGVA